MSRSKFYKSIYNDIGNITTLIIADKLNRKWIGVDNNPKVIAW
ncbi:MAG: hypothetical protein ACFFB9_04945 [Promethearchaeota archaeon]